MGAEDGLSCHSEREGRGRWASWLAGWLETRPLPCTPCCAQEPLRKAAKLKMFQTSGFSLEIPVRYGDGVVLKQHTGSLSTQKPEAIRGKSVGGIPGSSGIMLDSHKSVELGFWLISTKSPSSGAWDHI